MFSHSEYKDPYAPPLKPKVRVQCPPWVPTFKEYNGRPEWWAELAYKDVSLRRGFKRGYMMNYNEREPYWYDPKVPDGTSIIGPFGLDSRYHRNLTLKGDQPMKFDEHQKKVMESAAQYKNIHKKFDISPEHPGFSVSPLLEKYKEDHRTLGTHLRSHNFFQLHRGPRFWDKPINEGCIEKGLALAKYTAFISFCFAYVDSAKKDLTHMVKFTSLFKNYTLRFLPIPIALAMTFGVSTCTCAKIRNIDDTWNWTFGSIVTGGLHMTMNNYKLQQGIITSLSLITLFSYYQYQRLRPEGTQGFHVSQMFSGFFSPYTGPLNWKSFPINAAYEQSRAHIIPETWKHCSQ